MVPLPNGPLGDTADDLAALRATPVARIRADMTLFATQHNRGAQIAYRARRLTGGGPATLFADLSLGVSWEREGRSVLYTRSPLGDAVADRAAGGAAAG